MFPELLRDGGSQEAGAEDAETPWGGASAKAGERAGGMQRGAEFCPAFFCA